MTTTTHRGLGWFRDPFDSRDKDAAGKLFAAGASLPSSVNLYELLTADPRFEKVHDQGQTGSCVAWAAAQTMAAAIGIAKGVYYFASPSVIYKNARRAPYRDEGCYPRLAVEGLRAWGAPPITLQGAEFVEADINKALPVHVLQAGTKVKIKNYYKVLGTGPTLIENLRRALAAKHPVMFGQEVDWAFNNYSGGVLGKFSGASLGGHMCMVHGYSSDGNFLCKNQWGGGPTGWGEVGGALKLEKGFFRMSAERMMEAHVTDHYAFDVSLGSVPAP